MSYIDHFEDCKFIYIVTEYLKGRDLDDLMTKSKPFDELKVKNIVFKLSEGLVYLNKIGIVHRDLKPHNILVSGFTSESEIKIADFGVSIINKPNNKVHGEVGTLLYSAPELVSNCNYDHKVDIWSLGVITYHLLTGHLPYENIITEKHLNKSIVYNDIKLKAFNLSTKYSDLCKDFVMGCLNKDINKRFNINQIIKHNWFIE